MYRGYAGSLNGAYYFGLAMDLAFKNIKGFYTFQTEARSTNDGGVLTGPWDWTFLREPTIAECKFTLRETEDAISKLSEGED